MSAKASGLVWDLECPKDYNGTAFRPSHKFVLLAYADHADHNGKSIYPAVATIARKTGLDDRTVQRLTNDLEAIGLLVEDGKGPKGTNKWYLPFDEGGWHPVTPSARQGDKSAKSLGDMDSGDMDSGGRVSPELNKPEPLIDSIIDILRPISFGIFNNDWQKWAAFEKVIRRAHVAILDEVLTLYGYGEAAAYYDEHYSKAFNNLLVVNQRGGFKSLTFQE